MPLPLFRSLYNFNYRLWAAGGIVSNVGTWMQQVAQNWLVLTQLTHQSAAAVGAVMALQFGPQLLFLPLTGFGRARLRRSPVRPVAPPPRATSRRWGASS